MTTAVHHLEQGFEVDKLALEAGEEAIAIRLERDRAKRITRTLKVKLVFLVVYN